MGLSITLKAGVEQLMWLWGPGAVAQQSEHLQLKTNVDGMKDLLCSSTIGLQST